MKNIWLNEQECTGCGACVNICPVDAILLREDKYGYLMPKILKNCIDCNRCEEVCKKRVLFYNQDYKIQFFAAWSKSDELRKQSTSGGIFSELAQEILRNGGYVFGVAYNDLNLAEHICVDKEVSLDLIRRSKYIQSNTKYTFREIKKKLDANEKVLFCGSPCQILGLKAFLGKNYQNLITVDFICRGMNSNKAYRSWMEEIEKKYNGSISEIRFKYKKNGWKKSPFCTKVVFYGGKEIVIDAEQNLFMKGYLGHNLYIRPSCSKCQFKMEKRGSDITLADFWGVSQTLDDDKGTSLMIVRNKNEKTELLINEIRHRVNMISINKDEAIKNNMMYNSSVKISFLNKLFLNELNKKAFSYVIRKYTFFAKIVSLISKVKNVYIILQKFYIVLSEEKVEKTCLLNKSRKS